MKLQPHHGADHHGADHHGADHHGADDHHARLPHHNRGLMSRAFDLPLGR